MLFRQRPALRSITAAILCAALTTTSYAPPPAWWSDYETRILDPAKTPDNRAVANLGQLKHVASMAKKHLDQHLATWGSAGPAVDAVIYGFEEDSPDNFAPVNLGQLKAVAKPFYDRINAVVSSGTASPTNTMLRANGYPANWPHAYPWNPNDPINQPTPPGQTVDKSTNLAPVNLGQLKLVFSFDLATDTDGDLMADWWENAYGFSATDDSDAAADADGDGWTNGKEYQNGGNPQDSNSGAAFPVAKVIGNGAQGIKKTKSLTVTLPAGNRVYQVVIGVQTDEYPTYTAPPGSEYDDVVDWKITPAGGSAITGNLHVNSLHQELAASEALSSAFLGLSPHAIRTSGVVQADPAGPKQIVIEVSATNVSDATLPTTAVAALLPVEIIEVFERDQKWNKVPNPKNPPAYLNLIALPADLVRNYLFVAVEPASQKVELTIKSLTLANAGTGLTFLCGIRDTTTSATGPILPGTVPLSASGETQIDFTPTGNLKDNELITYRVVLGIDKNSDGQLSADEIITNDAPKSQQFYIKAITQADYQNSFDWLDWRDNTPGYPLMRAFVRYFDGNNSTLTQGVSLSPLTVAASATDNPSHIAGSPYNQNTGNTTIPKFQLPEGSDASNKIEDTFDRAIPGGLRTVIYNVWNANQAALAAPFNANQSLQISTSASMPIAQGTTISFYEADMDDLRLSYGGAGIHGTLVFSLKRDPANPLKVILTSVTINAVVEDTYDFDWTRPKTWPSRHGATVQIGWQPPARNAGRIFATETEVQRVYNNDGAITKFNNSYSIALPNPNPGTPIPPTSPTE